ncbi:MAG TPA: carboxypeptidase regulatory-like domain-containing protein, partial [Polyangiaceae bacterium LLY-WYZ-14_1]|nr:carboxypeptidase regulatory-like domain-containing protein [Polyangiaceae bacterium LLY-WYZ-14_1]
PPGVGPRAVEIRVEDHRGRPIPSAVVAWGDPEEASPPQAVDPRGRLTLRVDGEPEGRRLTVRAPGFARWTGALPADALGRAVRVQLVVAARVTGRVVAPDQTPIPDARLLARRLDVDGVPPHRAAVDDRGRFTFDALAPGVWEVTARAPGREATARTVVARSGVPAPPLRLVARPVGQLRVRVLQETRPDRSAGGGPTPGAAEARRPVPGAEVTLSGSSVWPPAEATTDAEGVARFPDLPAGVYFARAARGTAQGSVDRSIELEAGQGAEVTILLEPGWTIAVQVTDARTGAPLPEAAITVSDGLGASRQGRTDQAGEATFEGLPGPRPHLVAEASGYVATLGTGLGGPPGPEERAVRRRELAIGLLASATIEGRVVDPRGHPVPDARLEVVGTRADGVPVLHAATLDPADEGGNAGEAPPGSEGRPGGSLGGGELGVVPGLVPPLPVDATASGDPTPGDARRPGVGPGAVSQPLMTDEDGRFVLEDVPPGTLRVVATREGFAPGESASFTVAPGGRRTGLEVALLDAGALSGRVLDTGGFPIAGAPVTARAEGDPRIHRTVTGDDGTFGLRALVGLVFLEVAAPGQPIHRERVEVPPGGETDVEVTLAETTSRFRARLLDDRGFPVSGVAVTLSSVRADRRFRRHAVSQEDGTVRLGGLPPPPWRLRAEHPDHAPLELPRLDEEVDEVQLVLSPAAALTGRVFDDFRQEPVVGATVELDGEERTSVVQTREDGRFLFARIAPGPGTLVIRSPTHRPLRRAVTVAETGRDLGVLYLAPGGAVSGRVVDRWGDPAIGAEIAPGDPPDWDRAVRVDAAGRFTLSALDPGRHILTARHPEAGLAATREPVTIRKVEETPGVFLRLPRGLPEVGGSPEPGRDEEAGDDDDGEAAAPRLVALALTLESGPDGVTVTGVRAGSTARQAGLRIGDRVTAVDGEPVLSAGQARALLRGPANVPVDVTISRRGRERTITARRERVGRR